MNKFIISTIKSVSSTVKWSLLMNKLVTLSLRSFGWKVRELIFFYIFK